MRKRLTFPAKHGQRLVRAVAAVLLLAGLSILSACRNAELPLGTENLRFWCGFTGPDGITMLRMIKQFNNVNPESPVTMQRMDWGTYYNKLLVAGLGERSPEVFVLHITAVPRFRDAGLLEPIDDILSGTEAIPREDIDENVLKHVVHDGKLLALPLDVHPMGLYYNPELLAKAGLAAADGTVQPPKTRDEFLHYLRQYKKAMGPDHWGYAYANLSYDMSNFIAQWGGSMFSEDLQRCTLNDPRNVAAMQFAADLIHKEKLVPTIESRLSWIGFRQGKVPMATEGTYMLGDLVRVPGLNYKGAPLPQWGPQPGTFASSHVMCVSRGLTPEKRAAALRLLKHLSDHSLEWAEAGQVPVRKSLRETKRFQAMQVQLAFAEGIPNLMFRAMVPFDFEFESEFKYAVEKILYATETPQVALDKATANVNAVIARFQADEKRRQN